jgi:hypothetical protein
MRRCNHCGGQLGLIVHRNRMLRFCSKACKKAYEHKEEEERRAKHRHLAFLANATHSPGILGSEPLTAPFDA